MVVTSAASDESIKMVTKSHVYYINVIIYIYIYIIMYVYIYIIIHIYIVIYLFK